MKYYLKDILPRLKKYSASLDQSAFLVDKPWVVSNTDDKFEKLIFKRDGTLYLSSNGDVIDGKWEYLPEAKSLLIDYGNKKKLYRHQYLDEAVLALKIDGPDKNDENYYLLANENLVPNADAKQYLENKFNSDRNIEIHKLSDGSEIILQRKGDYDQIKEVSINGNKLEDGIYTIENSQKKL